MNFRPLRAAITRSFPLWILLLGHLFCGLFLRDLGHGLSKINDPSVAAFAQLLSRTYGVISYWVLPPIILLVIFLQIRLILKKASSAWNRQSGGASDLAMCHPVWHA